jgi:hypothetical protein
MADRQFVPVLLSHPSLNLSKGEPHVLQFIGCAFPKYLFFESKPTITYYEFGTVFVRARLLDVSMFDFPGLDALRLGSSV